MALCRMAVDAANEGSTVIDNRFIRENLPDADGDKLKVYLYGLYLCSSPILADNTVESVCNVLGMTESALADAFAYWRDEGLVTIVSQSPLEVRYNRPGQKIKLYKPGKFTDFNAQLQSIFGSRMLLAGEYTKYYEFLEETRLPYEVLLLVAGYCVRMKGEDIRSNYVLAVAKAWYALGIRTVEDAEKHIELEDSSTESLRRIAKALGKKSAIDLDDRQLYVKWTKSWGFSDEAILLAAKQCKKRGGMERLNALLDEYFVNNRIDPKEIEEYAAHKQEMYDLAKDVTSTIGVRYENLDTVISHYVNVWLTRGFDGDALRLIAEYCLTNGIRTLGGMNAAAERFRKNGCLDCKSINEYLASLVERDKRIKEAIAATGSSRSVTASDRDAYGLWKDWGFDDDVIVAAARECAGRPMAFGAVTKLLTACRDAKAFSVEAAEKIFRAEGGKRKNDDRRQGDLERKYTKEELSSFFGDIHDFDDIEV